MKKELSEALLCLQCRHSHWGVQIEEEDRFEIRKGSVRCKNCSKTYFIADGIIDMLGDKLPGEVAHEKEHAERFGYIVTENGEKFPINRNNLERFRSVLLTLPAGDGSHFFMPGGSFDNQAGNAERYFKTLDLLHLKAGDRVLEVGASFCWSPWHISQRGCQVVALDVTRYLMAGDLYMEKDGSFFDRVMGDMSRLPFKDQTFDLIFSHSVIHHCKDLKTLFAEFKRVLKPGGRVVALHECSFGIFENKSGKALQEAIAEGFNENAYTIPQWRSGALGAGFRSVSLHFFSLIEDYLYRKKLRKAKRTFKIALLEKIHALPPLEWLINAVMVPYRFFFRPKSWMLIAAK